MIRTNENTAKTVSLKFLYEIAAIPKDVRDGYFKKLTTCPVSGVRRKNSNRRKNVCLLKIIYRHIEENTLLEWDEYKICRKLDISKSMLYCHKHYLLKGLRELYFGLEKFKQQPENKSDEPDSLYKKASFLNDLGMKREAKNVFLKIYRSIATGKKRKSTADKFLMLKVNKNLCEYYYSQRNRIRFNKHFEIAERLWTSLEKNSGVNNKTNILAEIDINKNFCLIYKSNFKVKNDNSYTDTVSLFKKILEDSKEINDAGLRTQMLLNIGVASQGVDKHERTYKYFTDGERISKENGFYNEMITFKISLLMLECQTGKITVDKCTEEILSLYKRLNSTGIKNYLKKQILFNLVRLTSGAKNKNLYYKFLNEYNSHHILTNGYKSSLRMLYFMKFSYYLDKVRIFELKKDKKSGKSFFIVTGTNPVYHQRLEDTGTEILLNFDKMFAVYFTMETYMFLLLAEFWKGRNMDFDKSLALILRIEWLIRSRGKILSVFVPLLETLKLCINIINESKFDQQSVIINKYEQKFKELTGKNMEQYGGDIISSYSIFSYTAEQSGITGFSDIVKNLYFNLSKKYSVVFENFVSDLKRNEYTQEQTESEYLAA